MEQDAAYYRNLEQLLRAGTDDAVYFVDRQRRITFWNQKAEWLTGYPWSRVEGRCCWDDMLEHVDQGGNLLCNQSCPLKATIRNGQCLEEAVYLRHHDGFRQPARVWVGPRYGSNGSIIGAMQIFTDITRPGESLGLHHADLRTGLGNRAHLDKNLAGRVYDWERYGNSFGVLIAGIDALGRGANGAHGRQNGDKTLRMVARTLANTLRGSDVVTRYGEDEFAVIVRTETPEALRDAGERLRRLVAASRLPGSDHRSKVTISLGGAVVRIGDDAGRLLDRVETSLMIAKRIGRDQVYVDPAG